MHKYRVLFGYVSRRRGQFFFITAFTLLASGLTALQPWPVKLVVDQVIKNQPLTGWLKSVFDFCGLQPGRLGFLAIGTLGGLALFALSSALEVGLTWRWTLAGRRMVYDLAEDLFARLQRRSLPFHTRNSVGDTMSRITGDSWCVYQVADALFFAPFHALLTIGAMVFFMAHLNGKLTILSIVVAPVMIGASFLVGKPLRNAAKAKREVEIHIQSQIQQTLTGIPVVQAFAQEDHEHQRFERFAERAIRAQQRSALIGSINGLTSGLVATLGTALILFVGAQEVMKGPQYLTIGGLLVFLGYLAMLQAQMKILAKVYTALQGFQVSVDRVMAILDTEPEVADKPGARPMPSVAGDVRIQGVTFGYEEGRAVLRNVSLEAHPGECIAVVGLSGAGKSTLAGLIPRFFDPWEGRVSIDGKDLRDLRIEDVRRNVSLVLQESFLLPVSVAENIAYGRPSATRAEVETAARAANAHEFIEKLSEGYDTILGERGATLSGGERQRLSIARAIVRNAPILVLDEPTSALDSHTERSILEALDHLMKGRTTLIIAHRLSTTRRADRIVVLRAGQVIESGTHSGLLAKEGAYAGLYMAQFGREPEVVAE
jgi:ATP-binding cassette subfamily B protein/subfamily B ATP-binding cassette protein MsbA